MLDSNNEIFFENSEQEGNNGENIVSPTIAALPLYPSQPTSSPQPTRLNWLQAKQLSYKDYLSDLGKLKIAGHKLTISERVCFIPTIENGFQVAIDGQPYNEWKQEQQAFLAAYEDSNFLKRFLMDPFGKKRDEISKLRAYYRAKKRKNGP